MVERPKIPQVVSGEKLVAILRLWGEFSNWRDDPAHQIGGAKQIVTGILAEEAGLIINDTIIQEGVINTSPKNASQPFQTIVMAGKRAGLLRVRLYKTGITIDQLSENPSLEEILNEPENPLYYTVVDSAVVASTQLLNILWPEKEFRFVYGTRYKERQSTYRKWFLCSPKVTPDSADGFLLEKTRPLETDPNINRVEYLWGNGEIYTIDTPINKPFKPNLFKIERSLL